MEDFSLYIHIPFCVKKCAYCDFLSFPSDDLTKSNYIESLCNELIESGKGVRGNVRTIFFGGGTPTALKGEQLQYILDCIYENYSVRDDSEISIEMNPGTIDDELMSFVKTSSVNRVSIGLQSTHAHHLKQLSRIHTYEEFLITYKALRDVGINNINVDLMFGLPNQSMEEWTKTLESIVTLKPEHISAYGLIIEEGTSFYRLYEQGKLNLPDEELERDMYYFAKKFLGQNDIDQYEISNYGKAGYECQHNLAYWTDRQYQGIGLGASSYMNGIRYKNTEDMDLYIKKSSDLDKIHIIEGESSSNRRLEEAIFLGLRLLKGVHIPTLNNLYGNPFDNVYKKVLTKYLENKCLEIVDDHLRLTEQGMDVSNQVFSDFLIDEE